MENINPDWPGGPIQRWKYEKRQNSLLDVRPFSYLTSWASGLFEVFNLKFTPSSITDAGVGHTDYEIFVLIWFNLVHI